MIETKQGIYVPCLKHEKAAELFLGFRIGPSVVATLPFPKQMYFIAPLLLLVASSATLRAGLFTYSRRAYGKSTAEPVFYFNSRSRPARKRRSESCRASYTNCGLGMTSP